MDYISFDKNYDASNIYIKRKVYYETDYGFVTNVPVSFRPKGVIQAEFTFIELSFCIKIENKCSCMQPSNIKHYGDREYYVTELQDLFEIAEEIKLVKKNKETQINKKVTFTINTRYSVINSQYVERTISEKFKDVFQYIHIQFISYSGHSFYYVNCHQSLFIQQDNEKLRLCNQTFQVKALTESMIIRKQTKTFTVKKSNVQTIM